MEHWEWTIVPYPLLPSQIGILKAFYHCVMREPHQISIFIDIISLSMSATLHGAQAPA